MKFITRFFLGHGSEAPSFAVRLLHKLSQAGTWCAWNLIELDFFMHLSNLLKFIHWAAIDIRFVTRRACRVASLRVISIHLTFQLFNILISGSVLSKRFWVLV
jgi:hypothetical protein